jgi:hypothetical protein
MDYAVIDATSLINLLVTGRAEEVLRYWPMTWHVPVIVQKEVLFYYASNPEDPDGRLKKEWSFTDWLTRGIVVSCEPEVEAELDMLIHYETDPGLGDGEAACLAVARHRNWTLATDDRKALNLATQDGISTIQTVHLLMNWAYLSAAGTADIREMLNRIDALSNFKPPLRMPHLDWWRKHLE